MIYRSQILAHANGTSPWGRKIDSSRHVAGSPLSGVTPTKGLSSRGSMFIVRVGWAQPLNNNLSCRYHRKLNEADLSITEAQSSDSRETTASGMARSRLKTSLLSLLRSLPLLKRLHSKADSSLKTIRWWLVTFFMVPTPRKRVCVERNVSS